LLISACGTGKTLMAAHGTAKLLAGKQGSVLVLFPTLGLLEQTYRVWSAEAPFSFEALAVCSQPVAGTEDIAVAELPVENTTAPQRLAQWLTQTPGVRVVFATYQSVAVITAAHAEQGLSPWAVVVCDEAHRTAGQRGKPFAAVLDQAQLPAAHRLHFTATPKIHRGKGGESSRAARQVTASMDDPDLYGSQVFSLPTREAIERGILSPFRVAVIAVSDSAVAAAMRDLRMISLAAGQDGVARADHVAGAIALTQAAADHQLSSVLAFHNTIAASQEFAGTFLRTHRLLAAKRLVPDGRAATVTHIDGRARLRDRLAAAAILADHDPRQWNVVTNARCFTEGIDIPALDAVYFAEPRASEVDVAQAVGRAIRRNPHHDRPALVVLALTVDDSQDAETVIDVSSFKRVRQVLTALATHDPSITKDLARLRDVGPDTPPGPDGSIDTDLIEIHVPADLPPHLTEQFLRAFSIHTVDQLTHQWEQNFAALVDYTAQHGHASPPQQHRTPAGIALGQWVSGQRRAYARGRLVPERVQRLQELTGWAWNADDALWENSFAALAAYAERHGHSYPPRDFVSASGIILGHWVMGLRRPGNREKLDSGRRERLEALPGWSWERRTKPRWEEFFAALVEYAAAYGEANPPSDYVSATGIAVGRWVVHMRAPARRAKLAAARRRRLEGLPGWSWGRQLRSPWDECLAALQDYVAAHGHASPPQKYRTPAGLTLGRWVSEQRKAYAHNELTRERMQRLQDLSGWAWNTTDARWEQNFAALAAYSREHGDTQPPGDLLSATGQRVAVWAAGVRRAHRNNELPDARRVRVEALPGWSWDKRQQDRPWEEMYDDLAAYAAIHGHANPAQSLRTQTGLPLGYWVSEQRKAYRNRRLLAARIARLEELPGWVWNKFDALWENGFDELRRYCARTGSARPPKNFVSDSGYRLGSWVREQRRNYYRGQLAAPRRRRLDALPGWNRPGGPDAAWQQYFDALTRYADQHGHAGPIHNHVTAEGLGLGRWVSAQRHAYRIDSIAPDRAGRLESLPGWIWNPTIAAWDKGFGELSAYCERTGLADPPHYCVTGSGYALGNWVQRQRDNQRTGRLSADRRQRLESLPGWRWTKTP
jgi:superfamily II DNA or RNA helicase